MNPLRDLPEFTIIKPLEQWGNGYFVTIFEFAGLHWKLMQSDGKREEIHSWVKYEKQLGDKLWDPQHRWFESLEHYLPTFADTITVEMAVGILNTLRIFYLQGAKHGYADAQRDIRKAIGVEK